MKSFLNVHIKNSSILISNFTFENECENEWL